MTTLDELRAAYEAARADLAAEMTRSHFCTACVPARLYKYPDCPHEPDPNLMRDPTGRFILLDALAAIAQLEAATAPMQALTLRPGDRVLLTFPDERRIDDESAATMRRLWDNAFPGVDFVALAGGHVSGVMHPEE